MIPMSAMRPTSLQLFDKTHFQCCNTLQLGALRVKASHLGLRNWFDHELNHDSLRFADVHDNHEKDNYLALMLNYELRIINIS